MAHLHSSKIDFGFYGGFLTETFQKPNVCLSYVERMFIVFRTYV